MAESDNTAKDLGVMFLCLVAGYGLSQYQQNRRSQGQVCYTKVSDPTSLPDVLASKAEAVIRAGGQAGFRKVGALLELIVQNATGDTEFFRQALEGVGVATDAYGSPAATPAATPAAGTGKYAEAVEYFDPKTNKWRPL